MLTTLAPPPNGLAFAVTDLLLARAWAAFHGMRMRIHLDRNGGATEAEEVLAFDGEDGAMARWLIWRDEDTIYVQPAVGRTMRFARLADALDGLIPEPAPELTDTVGLPL